MLIKGLIIAGVALGGFLIYVAFKSPEVYVARDIVINATPEKIFPYINNSKVSNEWMTWMADDPSVKMSYSGPNEGLGSVASWESKGNMGIGNAEIIESVANRSVKTKLTYTKPMEMSQLAEVSLSPSAQGTLVRWALSSKNPFILRLMCVFGNMDKMIGDSFKKGLLNLKRIVEDKSK